MAIVTMNKKNHSKKIAVLYLIFSILWIALSDQAVLQLPSGLHAPLQLIKGWLFVLVTGAGLYYLLRAQESQTDDVIESLEISKSELSASLIQNRSLLEAIPVGVVEADFSMVKIHLDNAMKNEDGDLSDYFSSKPHAIYKIMELIELRSIDGAACKLFQRSTPEELITNFRDCFTDTSIEKIKEDVIAFYSGKVSVKNNTEYTRADGSIFKATTFASIAEGYEDSWGRLVVIIEDVSQKLASENALNSFFQLGVNIHLIATLDGQILRVNDGWKTTLGYTSSDLEGKVFLDFVHPEDIPRTLNEMSELEEGKTTFFFENRYRDKKGKYRFLTWSAISPTNSNLIYAVATDITDERKAQESLHQAASIIENTSEGIMVTDTNGHILDVNPAFSAITGYRRSDLIGQKASVLSSGHHDRYFYQNMWDSLLASGQWQGEIWNRNCEGEVYPSFLSISQLLSKQEEMQGYVGIFSDISDIKLSENIITRLKTEDALTGLPNATVFIDRVQHSVEHCVRHGLCLCVISVDIDNFKLINESLGFACGDELLKQAAVRLQDALRSEDTISRFGGDEFKVLMENIQDYKGVEKVVGSIHCSFKPPFELEEQTIYLTVSIGVSLFPDDGESVDVLIRNADTALSQAKQLGANQHIFYSKELTEAALESVFIENALRVAIDEEQFFLLYQPQFDLKTKKLIGMEVLLRWMHPEIGVVSPVKFIPVAESTGMIIEIGDWVLETACKQGKQWLDAGYEFGRIAVNVSGAQLMKGDLFEVVNKSLECTEFPPQYLELEVTESFIMQNPEQANMTLGQLRGLDIQTAIDDFGTGYSSLSYLQKLPIDKLKIDRSFVEELPQSEDGVAIVDAIISLGNSLSMTLIAEGVEVLEQEDSLIKLGCEQGQGFLYSKPLDSTEFECTYLTDTSTKSS